jgi:hypothetical protein
MPVLKGLNAVTLGTLNFMFLKILFDAALETVIFSSKKLESV